MGVALGSAEIRNVPFPGYRQGDTVVQWIVKTLEDGGLWPIEADAVVELLMELPEMVETMKDRWFDKMDGYPPQMKSVLWMSACDAAVTWIDANKPKHWARAVFAPGEVRSA